MKKALFVFAAFALSASLSFSQSNLTDTMKNENSSNKSAESGFAEDEFRRGVQSYYRGAFNESILEFEKALSYLPGEPRILDWLGKAYYRAGIEGAALQEWNYASQTKVYRKWFFPKCERKGYDLQSSYFFPCKS